MDRQRILDLAYKYVEGTATGPEMQELHQWYDGIEMEEDAVVVTGEEDSAEALRLRMLAKLMDHVGDESKPLAAVVPMRKTRKWQWAAAAAIAVGLLAGGIYYFNRPARLPVVATTETRFKNDLPAGGNRALLQLGDGSTIVLDSAANGELARQGATSIVKTTDGQLAYKTGITGAETIYNSISTPAGGEYMVTLADGSKVWLNAMSSLRFPTSFNGKERKVELLGEGYFEIAKNPKMPFKVAVGVPGSTRYSEVEVLGTHFNIKSYQDELLVKTTLLEGSVKITLPAKGNTEILTPGQQAQLDKTGNIKLGRADTEEVMAWHNGLFKFREVPIEDIMLQAKRWYGIEVVYAGTISEHFVSTIPRQSTAIQFFEILEKTGRVQFKIEGKKVTVSAVK